MSARTDVRGISVADAMPAISRAVSRLVHGQALEVLSSDPGSVLVLLAWTHASGNPLLDVRLDDDYRFAIQRGDRPMDTASHGLSATPDGAWR
jgi:TusA-related sulfurtransferase